MKRVLLLGIVCLFALAGGWAGADRVDFTLVDIHGVERRLSDYRGKWVVVNYWATWCPPCLEEIPELETFHDSHKDVDAVVLGVNLEDIDLARLQQFVEEQFISYPVLRDRSRARTELGAIPGMPTTYVVSPAGEVVARQVGGVTRDMLEDFLSSQTGVRSQKAPIQR